jgi:hypothetical protein
MLMREMRCGGWLKATRCYESAKALAWCASKRKAGADWESQLTCAVHFIAITVQTGVVPTVNGSAHLNLGRQSDESMGDTEVLAAAKLEVEDIAALDSGSHSRGVGRGGILCTVSWCVDPPLFILIRTKRREN